MLIYLASPYSHPRQMVQVDRFWAVCKAAARLMKQGHRVFSPIAHSHPIVMCSDLPTDWDYWREYDEAMLLASKELWVLTLPGWQESTGIKAEIAIAERLGLPIRHIHPETLEFIPDTSAQYAGV